MQPFAGCETFTQGYLYKFHPGCQPHPSLQGSRGDPWGWPFSLHRPLHHSVLFASPHTVEVSHIHILHSNPHTRQLYSTFETGTNAQPLERQWFSQIQHTHTHCLQTPHLARTIGTHAISPFPRYLPTHNLLGWENSRRHHNSDQFLT